MKESKKAKEMFLAVSRAGADIGSLIVPVSVHETREGAEAAVAKFYYGGHVTVVKVGK